MSSKIKILGAVVAAAAAVLVVAASSATAALPEFGQCVRTTEKNGEYASGNCVKHSVGNKGSFRWRAGPPVNPKFEAVGENFVLETTANRKLVCGGAFLTGEYTGEKTEKGTVHLVGCTDSVTKESCESNLLTEGEIESVGELPGEIGFIKGGEFPVVGLDLKPMSPSPYLFVFTCGNLPKVSVTEKVEGSVIGRVSPRNKMAEELNVTFRGTSGKQTPASFEGGAPDTLTTAFTTGVETTSEATSLKGLFPYAGEEPIEVKARP